jgi:hypothetical protein
LGPKTIEKPYYSKKFYIGVFLIITNFIVGKVAVPFFLIDFKLGTAIYLFSWLMLFAGLFLGGREGWNMSKFYYHKWKVSIAQNMKGKYSRKHKPNLPQSDDNH